MTVQTRARVVLLLAATACNTTSGGILSSLPVEVGGAARDGGGPLVFTTAQGWQVELDEAVFAVGPFYFYDQSSDSNGAQTGTCLVQVPSQSIVDALDPTLYAVDGGGSGQTGVAVSADIGLTPPGNSVGGPSSPGGGNVFFDPNASATYQSLIAQAPPFGLNDSPRFQSLLASVATNSSAFVAGSAVAALSDGGALVVPFYGYLTIDESTGYNSNDPAATPWSVLESVPQADPCAPAADGGACTLSFTTDPSVLQIRIDPSHLFDSVDFSTLIPPAPTCDAGPGCDAGPAWTPDAGPLSWNASGADSSFNTQLVEDGLHASDGMYFFDIAAEDAD